LNDYNNEEYTHGDGSIYMFYAYYVFGGFKKGFLMFLKGRQDISSLGFCFFITHQFGFTNPSRDLGKGLSDLENYPILV
jgi:hypothetical protein